MIQPKPFPLNAGRSIGQAARGARVPVTFPLSHRRLARWNGGRGVAVLVLAMVCGLRSLSATAQENVAWRIPAEELRIDYRKPPEAPRPVFVKDGFALALPIQLALVGRGRVRVTAQLAQDGRFTIRNTAAGSQVKVVETPGGGRQASVELRVALPLLTPEQAMQQAKKEAIAELEAFREQAQRDAQQHGGSRIREALRRFDRPVPREEPQQRTQYVELRMCELGKDELLQRLQQFAGKRPTWVDLKQARDWPQLPGPTLMNHYQNLRMLEIAAAHLSRWGFELNTSRAGTDRLISAKFAGLHALVSGKSIDDPDAQKHVKSLATEEQRLAREALTVTGQVLFYPKAEPGDANSQWFNGQRVQCSARGVSLVRVEGKLHPQGGDPADWWTLQGFDPNSVRLVLSERDGWDGETHQDGSRVHLRVHALRPGPIRYTFELVPREPPPAGREIHLHETSSLVPARFPF